MKKKWHGPVSDMITIYNGTSVLPHADKWQLAGMALYHSILFEITLEISVTRL
jgi:hypothetical protein